ncbi:MAG: hypothetical protein NVS2B7_15490 [Herpetosiphon sp.]
MAPILIVDDDTAIVAILQQFLYEDGYEVMVANNGFSALQCIALVRPALVITDIIMPMMHGLTLCHHLAENPDLCTIPLVLMSDRTNRGLLRDLSYTAFLQKPFALDELATVVRRLLAAPTHPHHSPATATRT